MRLRRLFEHVFAPSEDIDAGTVVGEGLGDHETDAGSTAGDDGDPVLHVEELLDTELGVRHFGM